MALKLRMIRKAEKIDIKKTLLALGIMIAISLGLILFRPNTDDGQTTLKQGQKKNPENKEEDRSSALLVKTMEAYQNQKTVVPTVSIEYANPTDVEALIASFLEIDPSLSNDLNAFILDPTSMQASVYSNFVALASNWEVREKIPLAIPSDTEASRDRRPTPIYKTYETDEKAAEEFEKNLQEREQSYELVEPEPDMISVQKAITSAMEACPVEFDPDQKPKVSLIRDFYLVFLWEHRRPFNDGTFHVASITVDAYSSEALTVQVREDLKNEK